MEDAYLEADALRMAVLQVEQHNGLLDALHAFLGRERNPVALVVAADAVAVVVGLKLEFRGVFVAVFIVHAVYKHFLFLALGTPVVHTVVVGIVLLVDEFALLAFVPDGAFGLVKTDDVDRIVQGGAFAAEHLVVDVVEHLAGLALVGRLGGTAHGKK